MCDVRCVNVQGCMMAVSLFGGFLCRYFCPIDQKGYIVTRKDSVFKVCLIPQCWLRALHLLMVW